MSVYRPAGVAHVLPKMSLVIRMFIYEATQTCLLTDVQSDMFSGRVMSACSQTDIA